jgi:predicted DCC family thiol-disulfide oxidoreductase YuxK
MKTNDKILLYDDYCPLCRWYSGLFVRFGLLKFGNRVAFSKADLSVLTAIDIEKGKDEIPLFDPGTHQTLYGIDALLEILGQKIPFIKSIGNVKPVKWFLKKLYKLISYNRKVIVARKCGPGTFDCSPVFSAFYRIVFLVIFLLFNSVMLFPLHTHVLSHLSFYHLNSRQLQAGHLVFVGINCLMATFLGRRTAIEYLGQVNMLALISILLSTILMFFTFVFLIPEWIILICLVLITAFIIKEYYRRMKYAGILTGHKKVVLINILCLGIFLGYVFH